MKNIFFKIPKDFKPKEVLIRQGLGVLIFEKKKQIIRAKIKSKRGK